MAGTKIGGKKAAYTNRLLHGVDFYARIGAKGGRNGHTGGFASMPRERVSEIGRRGGKRSSRLGVKNGEGRKGGTISMQWENQPIHSELEPEVEEL